MYYQDNFYAICVDSAVGVVLLYLAWRWLSRQRLYSQSGAAFSVIKERLKELNDGTLTHGMSEDDIKEVLRSHTGALQTMWPVLERMRAAEPRMCKFQQLSGGRPVIYWQWKGSK